MKNKQNIEIRLLSKADSVEELTDIIHRAYGQLAKLGFRYWGTHQSVEVTQKRISKGVCYVALIDDELVGTIMLHPPENTSDHPWYARNDVSTFHQFAVDPKYQKQGIGLQLLDVVEQQAIKLGAYELACDTAEGATHLISFYNRLGFREVAKADWEGTNYESVILSKDLRDA